jgi:hypothetical protein
VWINLGAALAESAIYTCNALPGPLGKLTKTQSVCGRSMVIAFDAATVANNRWKIRGFRRNGVYVFKGLPYDASTAGARRFMSTAKPGLWRISQRPRPRLQFVRRSRFVLLRRHTDRLGVVEPRRSTTWEFVGSPFC